MHCIIFSNLCNTLEIVCITLMHTIHVYPFIVHPHAVRVIRVLYRAGANVGRKWMREGSMENRWPGVAKTLVVSGCEKAENETSTSKPVLVCRSKPVLVWRGWSLNLSRSSSLSFLRDIMNVNAWEIVEFQVLSDLSRKLTSAISR